MNGNCVIVVEIPPDRWLDFVRVHCLHVSKYRSFGLGRLLQFSTTLMVVGEMQLKSLRRPVGGTVTYLDPAFFTLALPWIAAYADYVKALVHWGFLCKVGKFGFCDPELSLVDGCRRDLSRGLYLCTIRSISHWFLGQLYSLWLILCTFGPTNWTFSLFWCSTFSLRLFFWIIIILTLGICMFRGKWHFAFIGFLTLLPTLIRTFVTHPFTL